MGSWRESFRPLRHSDYRKLLLSTVVTSVGWWFTFIALFGQFAFEAEAGAISVAGLTMVSALPSALISPVAGTIVDRFDRRRLMITTELVSGAVVFALVFYQSFVVAYASIFVLGAMSELFHPAQRALLPAMLSDEDDLLAANGLLSNVSTIARIGGPGLAGFAIAFLEPEVMFLADAASYVLSAVVLYFFGTYAVDADEDTLLGSFRIGVRYLFDERVLLWIVGLSVIGYAGAGAYNAILPLYVREVMSLGSSTFGYLTTATAFGAFLASVTVTAYGDVIGELPAIAGSIVVLGACIFALTALQSILVVAVVAVLMGFSFTSQSIYAQTTIQSVAGSELTGRINGLYRSTNKVGQIGAMVAAGVVTANVGVVTLFSVTGVFLLVLGAGAVVLFTVVTNPSRG